MDMRRKMALGVICILLAHTPGSGYQRHLVNFVVVVVVVVCLFVSVAAFPDLMELRLATPQQPESNLIHPSSVRLKFPASTISFRSKYSKNSHFRFPLPVLPVPTSGTSGSHFRYFRFPLPVLPVGKQSQNPHKIHQKDRKNSHF